MGAYYPDNASHYQLRSECREHDLVLLDIGKRFSGKGHVVRYLPENVLQSGQKNRDDEVLGDFVKINSDAYLDLLFKGRRYNVAVEFENAKKSPKRYKDLVKKYHSASMVDVIFYFYKEDYVRETIAKIEAADWPREAPKFYFCKVEDGRDWSKKIHLTDRKGQKVGV